MFDPLGLGGGGGCGDIDQAMQQQSLWMSAKMGDANGVAQVVSKGTDANDQYVGEDMASAKLGLGDEGGADSALLEAAQDGDTARVQRALAGGASLAATNDWGTTCLHISVKGGHAEVTCQSAFVWGRAWCR